MKIPILYEDNHLLVVEKPVNIPVQGDDSRDKDLLTILKEDIKVRFNKPGNVYLGLVHRLDRPVGGVMVFAKTSKAASRLSEVIRKNELERKYLAVVRGVPKKNKAKLEHYLYKDTKKNKVHAVSATHKEAKKAVLDYETIRQFRRAKPFIGSSSHRSFPSNSRATYPNQDFRYTAIKNTDNMSIVRDNKLLYGQMCSNFHIRQRKKSLESNHDRRMSILGIFGTKFNRKT